MPLRLASALSLVAAGALALAPARAPLGGDLEALLAAQATQESEVVKSLRSEIKQLKRNLYLLNMRKDNCPVGQLLGDWNSPNHPSIAQNYDTCYPKQVKIGYCMNGYRGNKPVGPAFLDCDKHGGVWKPPQNPLHEAAAAPQRETAMHFARLVDGGHPHTRNQFPIGLYDQMYFDPATGTVQWRAEDVQMLLSKLKSGQDVSPKAYPEAMKDMMAGMAKVPGGLANKTVLVVGSISPWVESIALHMGAKEVTTADYALASYHDNMATSVPQLKRGRLLPEMLADVNVEQVDVILSYSSIEHDGLGRYGDPVFADGDLAAMREIYLFLKPGGTLVLGVPSEASDANPFYSQRVYGPVRFPVLTRGWNYRGSISDGNFNNTFLLERFDKTGFSPGFGIHAVVLLEKPSVAPESLEYLYEEEECTMKCEWRGKDSFCYQSGWGCRD